MCDCSGAGGQPDNNKGPALSLSPVIFQLSEKLLWHRKKVKLKSLAWYVLTTACRLCNTSKYFLSSHSCSLWKGNRRCVCSLWAGQWCDLLLCTISQGVKDSSLNVALCQYWKGIVNFLSTPSFKSYFSQPVHDLSWSVCLCVLLCSMSTLNAVCPL